MDILVGQILSHYRIVEQIGAGGMGVVYRAHDDALRRDVAVKVLPPSFATDAVRLRRFEQEARAAGSLNHPNILSIYDFGEHGGSPYVVSELLEGKKLRERLGAGALPVRKAVEYGVQIARGLSAAHEKGIVHRDLKPENLFVTNDGRVKILDFGIAKLMSREEEGRAESAATQTEAGVILGSTGYMSPEQVRGETVDHRTDLFALPRWLVPVAMGVVIAAFVALAALTNLGGWRDRLRPTAPAGAIRSLAVLPLQNLSAAPEQEYFVDGMTEGLTATLAQVGTLKVISRTSSTQYKGTKKSLRDIGRELGVDALIEGSVLRAGNRVRVTAQLIRAATDEHLWAQSYERDLRDVLTLQSGLAREIAGEVVKVASPRGAAFAADRTVDPAAHEAYLMGRFFWNKRTPEDLNKAMGYFRRSVERDSTYARAHSAIADYYNVLPFYTRTSPSEAFPKAKASALKALAIDDSLGGAHAALAFEMAYYEWDWAGAEREFQRALALTPSDAKVHHSYSRYLVSTGRTEEGMAELKRAQELDPLSLVLKANEGMVLFFEGRYDEAIAQLRRVLELDSTHPVAHWGLGLAMEQKGLYADAVREIQKASDPG
jgi:serine/threonine protein kinase